jgi:hypothetical protein
MAKIAPYMRRVGEDLWEDGRDGELLQTEELYTRFSIRRVAPKESRGFPDWLSQLMGSVHVRLIETQRLILQKRIARRVASRNRPPGSATITDYAHQLATKIQASFNEYARLSQQLDQTFVIRLLKHDFGGWRTLGFCVPNQPTTLGRVWLREGAHPPIPFPRLKSETWGTRPMGVRAFPPLLRKDGAPIVFD